MFALQTFYQLIYEVNMKNKWILVLLFLMVSALLVTPLFANPKVARPAVPKSVNEHRGDVSVNVRVNSRVSRSDIREFLDDYDDFVQDARRAYNAKDVETLRRLKKESISYEDRFFDYKKSNSWTSEDTSTFVSQTKTLEKYLLNRFYEKPVPTPAHSGGKIPPAVR